jgi:HK97 gp10 family phage protein
MGIETTGIAEMKARMMALRQEVSGPMAAKAVRAGGRVIRDSMKELTPVLIEKNAGSDALPPGTVKNDIRVRMPAKENQFETVAVIGPGPRARFVAHLVEYGHRMVTGGISEVLANGKLKGPGRVHEKDVPAHPFLRPAFEESLAAAQEKVVESLREDLGKVGA